LGIVQLAQSALTDGGKIEIVRPLLMRVAHEHSVTVTLWRISGNDRNVLISSAQNNSTFQIQMQVGQRVPIYIGAFGRVLAYHHRLGRGS
jgi:DNA-binding IclR family transcriptional regulator